MSTHKPKSRQAFEDLDGTHRRPPATSDTAGPVLRIVATGASIIIAALLVYYTFPQEACLLAIFSAFFATRSACANAREKHIATNLTVTFGSALLLFFAFNLFNSNKGEGFQISPSQLVAILISLGLLFVGLPVLIIREIILLFTSPTRRVVITIMLVIIGVPALFASTKGDTPESKLVASAMTAFSLCLVSLYLARSTTSSSKPPRSIGQLLSR
jgi:glucan phosphoethanolaminetransferase (alkaline phosphatase superfamily)